MTAVRSRWTLIDLTGDEPADQGKDFLRGSALIWGATDLVCEEMAGIGVDLVRGVLAYSAERSPHAQRSRDATLRVRSTSAGMAVAEIWDVRIPSAALARHAPGQPLRARPHRPLHRFYRLARLRIGPPRTDDPADGPDIVREE